MTHQAIPTPNPAEDLMFLTRGVTHPEAAAVSAVLSGLLREESDSLRKAPEGIQSAWQNSARSIRPSVRAGQGQWRGFSA
jgi:hypothetical protein